MLRYSEKEMNSEETKIDVILKSILETLEKESGSDWKSVKITESHPIYQFYNEKTHRLHSHAIMIGNKADLGYKQYLKSKEKEPNK
jgi:hypothetical protein